MRLHLYRWLLPAGLAAGTLLGMVETSSAQPVVRDHRDHGGPKRDRGPREAPPPIRVETHEASRPGYIWVAGSWEWRGGRWEWTAGRWERERAKQRWLEGRWERRGDRWEYVDGRWDTVPDFPTQPPPPLQVENPGARPGYVWMPGNYRWIDGRYVWYAGRWEQARPCKRLVAGQWGLRGDRYVFNSEVWLDEPGCRVGPPPPPPPPTYPTPPPVVVSGPTQAPPPPRDENYGAPRDGYVWARGFFQWKNGAYDWVPGHWERKQAARQWADAKWELRGTVWIFVEGGWR